MYGAGIPFIISDKILNVKLDSGDIKKGLRGISKPTICGWTSMPSDPVLHVEWIVQQQAAHSLATLCVNRTSSATLYSMKFAMGANIKGTKKSYYNLTGCVAKNWSLTGSKSQNEYICKADFSVGSVATFATRQYIPPTALGTKYASFNNSANTITITGKKEPAFITDSVEIMVNNNVTDHWDIDGSTKVLAIGGAKDVTATSDISLDDGGAVQWSDVYNGKPLTSLALQLNIAGINDLYTLSDGYFTNTSIDQSLTNDLMMVSQPMVFKEIAIT
jgi:hypothetical protein